MARILLTWELGAGLAHLMNFRSLARGLAARGHQVCLAVRELSQVHRVFEPGEFPVLQAPWKSRRVPAVDPIVTFADLLFNIGFAEPRELASLVDAWRHLFAMLCPDLILCDHSPTALVAARGAVFACGTVGSGFFCPVDEAPIRPFPFVDEKYFKEAVSREQLVLGNINQVLRTRNLPAIEQVTKLFHNPTVENYLLTYPELDHYPHRREGRYWGARPYGAGDAFVPPGGDGPCVFGYLKPFPAMEAAMEELRRMNIRGVIYADGWESSLRAKHATARLQFPNGPIAISDAAKACDLAITNSTHGASVAMLLAGKPLVQIPLLMEQALFGQAVERLRAGITGYSKDPKSVAQCVGQVLDNPKYRSAAQLFAAKYRDFPHEAQLERMLDRMEAMAQRHG
jgi:UDP:flavonoid glycosyltransferase YjiC (YdhE family)